MKKEQPKRYFSLMFVPDQDGDPKSLLLSYGQGKLLLAAAAVLVLHAVLGVAGYVYIGSLQGQRAELQADVRELEARNKKIESIYAEFEKIKAIDQKIRTAFGSTLGLEPEIPEDWAEMAERMQRDTSPETGVPDRAIPDAGSSVDRSRDGLYFLVEKKNVYTGPEFLPTLLPVGGYLTTHFQEGGWYVGRSHYGIDIAASKGSVIRAAGSGVVVLSDWTPDLGNMVVLSHGNGLFSYYGHAMHLLVEQGVFVRKGQPLALLGSSGISSAPHLHFEIWKNGEPLDPENYLFALRQRQDESSG